MATTITAAGKHVQGAALAAACTHAALLNASGTEISGGSPAYARKAITLTDTNGVATLGTSPVFDVPAATVAYVAYYSAATAGTEYARASVTNEVFAAQGTYTLTSGTITIADPA